MDEHAFPPTGFAVARLGHSLQYGNVVSRAKNHNAVLKLRATYLTVKFSVCVCVCIIFFYTKAYNDVKLEIMILGPCVYITRSYVRMEGRGDMLIPGYSSLIIKVTNFSVQKVAS